MGSSCSASVAICWRPRTQLSEMVARTTLVVFTIIVAALGVSIPESERELQERETNKNIVKRSDGSVIMEETVNSQTKVKREAKKDPKKIKKSPDAKKKK